MSNDQSKCPGHDRPECVSCCWPKSVDVSVLRSGPVYMSEGDLNKLKELMGEDAAAQYAIIQKPDQGYTAVDMNTAAADGFREGQKSHWQTIDSCPNYEDVLFFHPRDGVIPGRMTDADSLMTEKERDEWDGTEDALYCIDAFGYGDWGLCRMDGTEAPTHWMPMPSGPENEQ